MTVTTPDERERKRAYYRKHRKKLLAYQRRYHREHREERAAYSQAWYAAHPDYDRERREKRKAKRQCSSQRNRQ